MQRTDRKQQAAVGQRSAPGRMQDHRCRPRFRDHPVGPGEQGEGERQAAFGQARRRQDGRFGRLHQIAGRHSDMPAASQRDPGRRGRVTSVEGRAEQPFGPEAQLSPGASTSPSGGANSWQFAVRRRKRAPVTRWAGMIPVMRVTERVKSRKVASDRLVSVTLQVPRTPDRGTGRFPEIVSSAFPCDLPGGSVVGGLAEGAG